jgi:DNA-binding transcriptional MerR regulator
LGDLDAAEAAYQAVLADQIRVLGPDHPHVLATRHNLAGLLSQRGDIKAAEAAYQAVLADQIRVLGPDHPDVLATRHNLAGLLSQRGDIKAAEAEAKRSLAGVGSPGIAWKGSVRVPNPEGPDRLSDVGYRAVIAMGVAGVSYRQLDYWSRTGLVTPSVSATTGPETRRHYSIGDIVLLMTAKRLLEAGVGLDSIRQVIDVLRERTLDELGAITLVSDGDNVYECRSPNEVVDLLSTGKGVFGIAVGALASEVDTRLRDLHGKRATGDQDLDRPQLDTDRTGATPEAAGFSEAALRQSRAPSVDPRARPSTPVRAEAVEEQRVDISSRTALLEQEPQWAESPTGHPTIESSAGMRRKTLARDLVTRYSEGESIRALASSTGRSYGFIHRILTEAGVQLRQRGGARRRKRA